LLKPQPAFSLAMR